MGSLRVPMRCHGMPLDWSHCGWELTESPDGSRMGSRMGLHTSDMVQIGSQPGMGSELGQKTVKNNLFNFIANDVKP